MGSNQPSCSKCSELFGTCTSELCAAISPDCYYDAQENGLNPTIFAEGMPRCVAKQDMACRYYDRQQDCIGKTPAVFDSQTNRLTTPSNDKLGLGVCARWIQTPEGGHCIKNADRTPDAREDDCLELGVFNSNPKCVEDRTPPVTTFTPNPTSTYSSQELNALPFTAQDDFSPQSDIKTYVCFTTNCYPNQEVGAINPLPTVGSYTMRYFSADKHGNLEVIKSAPITVTESSAATLIRVEVKSS
jgi:hypothetical protein